MNLYNYKTVSLLEVVEIERAKSNKIYNADSIIIQVSASRGQIHYLGENTLVDSRYVVLTPKNINGRYLYYILAEELPLFLNRYQTGINIQPEVFKHLKIQIHDDLQTQKHVSRILSLMDESIEKEEKITNKLKQFKDYHLNKMFV